MLSIEDTPRGKSFWSSNHTRVGPSLPSTWNEGGIRSDKLAEKNPEGIVFG
jgi:hypothetical protein